MQAQTGAVISGSLALQFFERTRYEGSDMDLYVEHWHAEQVLEFLLHAGYTYTPQTHQLSDCMAELNRVDANHGSEFENYPGAGIISALFNFMKGERKIQIMTACSRSSVFGMILRFHSSEFAISFSVADCNLFSKAVVMNVITHRNAFSLYPRSSFIERRSLAFSSPMARENRERALEKYDARGWDIFRELPIADLVWFRRDEPQPGFNNHTGGYDLLPDSPREFSPILRGVGDQLTWTIALPEAAGGIALPQELADTNTWRLERHVSDYLVHIEYSIDQSPTPGFQTTRAKVQSELALHHISRFKGT